ncbi:MAG: hypothetical protein LBO67_03385 [Spirochaetaceae bacterium]|jgi:hypothetical protein|nr:hypothetical protein [Spirochaetaceae bacterium]
MDVTVFDVVVLVLAVFVCVVVCCSSSGNVRQGTGAAGADSGELLKRDQQDIRKVIDGIGDSTTELTDRIEQDVATVIAITAGIDTATGYTTDIAQGINDSLFLIEKIGDGLDQLEGILRELEKRTGLTDGVGEEKTDMD